MREGSWRIASGPIMRMESNWLICEWPMKRTERPRAPDVWARLMPAANWLQEFDARLVESLVGGAPRLACAWSFNGDSAAWVLGRWCWGAGPAGCILGQKARRAAVCRERLRLPWAVGGCSRKRARLIRFDCLSLAAFLPPQITSKALPPTFHLHSIFGTLDFLEIRL